MSNFIFLTDGIDGTLTQADSFLQNLRSLGEAAETLLDIDAQCSVFKTGCLCEQIINDVFDAEIGSETTESAFEKLNVLSNGYIPNLIYAKLDAIRSKRNKVVHENLSVNVDTAVQFLNNAFDVTKWYYSEYQNAGFDIGSVTFARPQNCIQVQIEEAIAAVKRELEEIRSKEISELQERLEHSQEEAEQLKKQIDSNRVFRYSYFAPLETAQFSDSWLKSLKRVGIQTLGALASCPKEKLMRIYGLGKRGTEEVISFLRCVEWTDMPKTELSEDEKMDLAHRYAATHPLMCESIVPVGREFPLEVNSLDKFWGMEAKEVRKRLSSYPNKLDDGQVVNHGIMKYHKPHLRWILNLIDLGVVTHQSADDSSELQINQFLTEHCGGSEFSVSDMLRYFQSINQSLDIHSMKYTLAKYCQEEIVEILDNGNYRFKPRSFFDIVNNWKEDADNNQSGDLEREKTKIDYDTIWYFYHDGKTDDEISELIDASKDRRHFSGYRLKALCSLNFYCWKHNHNLTFFAEDVYNRVFIKYKDDKSITPQDWERCGINSQTYNYLAKRYGKLIPDSNWELTPFEKNIEKELTKNQIISIDGISLKKAKDEIEEYLIRRFCMESIELKDYLQKCKECIENNNIQKEMCLIKLPEWKAIETGKSDTLENRLGKRPILLHSMHRRYRFYDTDSVDIDELSLKLSLVSYHNIEISTLKLFNEYPELMQQFDIRDQYELCDLLSKKYKRENVTFDMPMIKFGTFDRNKAVLDILVSLSQQNPAEYTDIRETLISEYGLEQVVADQWMAAAGMMDYRMPDGRYSLIHQTAILTPYMKSDLQKVFNENFYTYQQAEQIIQENEITVPSKMQMPELFNAIGFRTMSSYAFKGADNAKMFFENNLLSGDEIDISDLNLKFCGINQYYSVLRDLQKDFKLVEISDKRFVTSQYLNNNGITSEMLEEVSNSIKNFVDDQYFTIRDLRANNVIPETGLWKDDYFCSSIIKMNPEIRYISVNNHYVFKKTRNQITRKDLIIDYLMSALEVGKPLAEYEIIQNIKNKYGVCLYPFEIKLSIEGREDMHYESRWDAYRKTI